MQGKDSPENDTFNLNYQNAHYSPAIHTKKAIAGDHFETNEASMLLKLVSVVFVLTSPYIKNWLVQPDYMHDCVVTGPSLCGHVETSPKK